MGWTFGKLLLWLVGGAFALGFAGVLLLYVFAGVAMWKSGKVMEREEAAQVAAFQAMTPEQRLARAQAALDKGDAYWCLDLLRSVPEGTAGRAELLARAQRIRAEQDARAAQDAGSSSGR